MRGQPIRQINKHTTQTLCRTATNPASLLKQSATILLNRCNTRRSVSQKSAGSSATAGNTAVIASVPTDFMCASNADRNPSKPFFRRDSNANMRCKSATHHQTISSSLRHTCYTTIIYSIDKVCTDMTNMIGNKYLLTSL